MVRTGGTVAAMASPSSTIRAPRSVGSSIAVGIGVAVASAAIAFFVIAIPLYTLASFEPNGIDRPVVRTGLFQVAMPVGVVIGLVAGAVAGRWARRGGTWTVDDGGDRYSTR
jgi:uncharacterized membrane protein